jgi:hypothetical protein
MHFFKLLVTEKLIKKEKIGEMGTERGNGKAKEKNTNRVHKMIERPLTKLIGVEILSIIFSNSSPDSRVFWNIYQYEI